MKLSNLLLMLIIGLLFGIQGAMGMEGDQPLSPRTAERQRVREVWRAMDGPEIVKSISIAYARACGATNPDREEDRPRWQPVMVTHEAFLKRCIKYDAYHGLLLAIRMFCNRKSISVTNVEGLKVLKIPGQNLRSLLGGLQHAIDAEALNEGMSVIKFLDIFFPTYRDHSPEHLEVELPTLPDIEYIQNIYTQRIATILHIAKHILTHHFEISATDAEGGLVGHCFGMREGYRERRAFPPFDDIGATYASLFLTHKKYTELIAADRTYKAHIDLMEAFNDYAKGITSKSCITDDERETGRRVEKIINEDTLLHLLILTRIFDVGTQAPLVGRLSQFRSAFVKASNINTLGSQFYDDASKVSQLFEHPDLLHTGDAQAYYNRCDAVEDLVDIIQSDAVVGFFYNTIIRDIIAAFSMALSIQQGGAHNKMLKFLQDLNVRIKPIKDAIERRNALVQGNAPESEIAAQEHGARILAQELQIAPNAMTLEQYHSRIGATELSSKTTTSKEEFLNRLRLTFAEYTRGAITWFNTMITQQGQTFITDRQGSIDLGKQLAESREAPDSPTRQHLITQKEKVAIAIRAFVDIFRERFKSIFDMAKEVSAFGESETSKDQVEAKKYIVLAVYKVKNTPDLVEVAKDYLALWAYTRKNEYDPLPDGRIDSERLKALSASTSKAESELYNLAYEYSGHVAANDFAALNWQQTPHEPAPRILIDANFLQGQRSRTSNWGDLMTSFLQQPSHLKLDVYTITGVDHSFAEYQKYPTVALAELTTRPPIAKLDQLKDAVTTLHRNLTAVSAKFRILKGTV